jgi:pimeloyl-ACP methyl ester carboxylesterase
LDSYQAVESLKPGEDRMAELDLDGVRVGFDDVGHGQAVVLVHGWGCNRRFFEHQISALSSRNRVISLDLRGHGESSAPHQDYTMQVFADDIASVCAKLRVHKPIIVGHSMGGNAALQLAASHPDLAKAIVLIDSLLFPSEAALPQLQAAAAGLQSNEFQAVVRLVAQTLFIPTDNAHTCDWITTTMESTPQHVLAPAFVAHTTGYDAGNAIKHCSVPAAYIGAQHPLADLSQLRSLWPDVLIAQTLGAGHFSPMEVPDQINAMLRRFIELYA